MNSQAAEMNSLSNNVKENQNNKRNLVNGK